MAVKNLIGVVGLIGSGKDTVSQYIKQRGYVQDSFAASLKDIVSVLFGWPRELLEGDTEQSRAFRETVDLYWSKKLDMPAFTPRYALQYIGTEVLRNGFHQDIWLSSLEYRLLKNENSQVIISDTRFENEVDMIRGAGGVIIRVKRGDDPEWWPTAQLANQGDEVALATMKMVGVHYSEWAWANTVPDFVINNDGTLEELYSQVDQVLEQIQN